MPDLPGLALSAPRVRLAYHPQGGPSLTDEIDERLAYNDRQPRVDEALSGDRPKYAPDAPRVRLAWSSGGNGGPTQREDMMLQDGEAPTFPLSPTMRLATAEGRIIYEGGSIDLGLREPEPTVRLAHKPSAQGDNNLLGVRGVAALPDASRPSLLVSYFYLQPFLKNRHRYRYRDWVMDSGAFSAENSGAAIDLRAYIECCRELLETDPTLTEVYALDVIGDWKATLRNAEAMWAAGIPAIPCFHVGSPESVLVGLARDYPKIALGGAVGFRGKDKWAAQCFARVWPKPIHGFGFGSEKSIMTLPFHSVDATNWEIGPCKFGRWQTYGQMSVRGSKQNLRSEVEWYLRLEQRARARWAPQMIKLGEAMAAFAPTVRLGVQQANDAQVARSGLEDSSPALNPPPSVRLAVDPAAASGQRLEATLGDHES